ncbi:MAG: mechanosensitive ion channel domain-containing protein [Verrucomicrobiota bacterium]
MNDAVTELFVILQKILEYPLVKLGQSQLTLLGIVKLLVLVGLVMLGERLLRKHFVLHLLKQTRLDPPLQYTVSRIVGYVFIVFGFYVALLIVGIDLSSLAVIAGAVGLGLGFGLQNIISNFVSGLIILAERPITIGDRIEVGNVVGQVTKISLRSTTVVTNDNITIIVPNSDFISSRVINWSHGDPRVRLRLPVGVAYGTNLELLQRVLLEVARDHPKVLRQPEPALLFIGFGESALDFELAVWTSEMTFAPRRFRSELYFAIEKKLRENNIQIPFPQRDLHLRSGTFVLPTPSPPPSGPREPGC